MGGFVPTPDSKRSVGKKVELVTVTVATYLQGAGGRVAVEVQLVWGEARRGESVDLASLASPGPGSRLPGR